MIVSKFGGTSVGDAEAIRRLVSIVKNGQKSGNVIVVSACSGVTTALEELAQTAAGGVDITMPLQKLLKRHECIANDLFSKNGAAIRIELENSFLELTQILRSVTILRELTPRTLDRIWGYGESWSSQLVTEALTQSGLDVQWIDARSLIVTDHQWNGAVPLMKETMQNTQEVMLPHLVYGKVIVTQGFIGATKENIPTTLGRGGSDYTASLIGAALDAKEIRIWTDTDGVLSADPRVVKKPVTLDTLSYGEAAELAQLGAKVLHPKTIAPAIERSIPVKVMNSRNINGPQTVITGCHVSSEVGEVRSVTSRPSAADPSGNILASVSLVGSAIDMEPAVLARASASLSNARISVRQAYYGESGNHLTFLMEPGLVERSVSALHDTFIDERETMILDAVNKAAS